MGLGPLFFAMYTADVFDIFGRHGFAAHGYADDLQIYAHCLSGDVTALSLRFAGCVGDVGGWMSSNRLKLNASKTEIIWMGSSRRLAGCISPPICILGDAVLPVNKVRSLGVVLDSALTFSSQVTRLVNTCYYHLRQLRSIRHSGLVPFTGSRADPLPP